MRPLRRFSLGFVDTRIGPACRHACDFHVCKRLICQARSSTIPGLGQRSKPVHGALTAGQRYRLSIPDASRITMSVNTTSVSIPFMTPVISSSTNPCMADQNSSDA
jgi:hypothetical protein